MQFSKAFGLVGYVGMLIGLAFAVLAIGGAAGGHNSAIWFGIAAALTLITAIVLIAGSRGLLTSRPVRNRTHQDPLQPEVTPEEEAWYEDEYRPQDDVQVTQARDRPSDG
ncbi:hypothetical protein [Gordonia soli]|uniref:Uncharacterized protein n=1 Tax=Gordonia soli NBRC 108243 TaxID=1223545 RepID=M0QJD2_9ACTN|nr:hypothetical protein [Gordonia soli]GAC67542.1 hypothetical protein GS4_08_01270 [Gordonia soli NBRC 108243]